jgi:hypothetical protein
MKLRIYGPLVLTILLFTVAFCINLIAFSNSEYLIELPSEFSLWTVGVFLSLAVTDHTIFGGFTESRLTPAAGVNTFQIEFGYRFPKSPELSPKFIYMLVYCMLIWVVILLTSGKAKLLEQQPNHDGDIHFLMIASWFLSATTVGLTIRALRVVPL